MALVEDGALLGSRQLDMGNSGSNVQNIGTGFVLIAAGQYMSRGSFTVGDLSLFVFYLGHTQWFASEVGRVLTEYRQVGVSIDRLLQLMPGADSRSLVAHSQSYLFRSPPEIPIIQKMNRTGWRLLKRKV